MLSRTTVIIISSVVSSFATYSLTTHLMTIRDAHLAKRTRLERWIGSADRD
jgi:hypothetical protein